MRIKKLVDETWGWSFSVTFVCGFVYVNVAMYESEISSYAVAKVSIFQLTTAVFNHSTASSVQIRPLKVYIFQLCGTYTSSGNSKICAPIVKMLLKPGTMWLFLLLFLKNTSSHKELAISTQQELTLKQDLWLLLFCGLCHSSLRMLSSLVCLVIKVLGSWTWYISWPPPENKFCCESPLPGTQW